MSLFIITWNNANAVNMYVISLPIYYDNPEAKKAIWLHGISETCIEKYSSQPSYHTR